MIHEYIDRFKLLDDLNETKLYKLSGQFEKIIRDQPAADVDEVKHGRWQEIRNAFGEIEGWIHSDCGREVKSMENYCPKCGAKMDAEKKPKGRKSKRRPKVRELREKVPGVMTYPIMEEES